MLRMSTKISAFLVVVTITAMPPAFGALNQTERSVEQTGETLTAGRFELGLAKLMYGVTDGLQIETNYLYDIYSAASFGAKKKFDLTRGVRVTPYFQYLKLKNVEGQDFNLQAGATIGITRGDRKQHSFAVTISGRSEPYLDLGESDPDTGDVIREMSWRKRNRLWMGFDYSYYTPGGNLAFVGSDLLIPYFGFTWAWENVHAGLLLVEVNSWSVKNYVPFDLTWSANFSYFIPVPYLFLRF